VDRRTRRPVDCTKIIWIVATNALDPIISEFSRCNEGSSKEADNSGRGSQLQSLLNSGAKAKFGVTRFHENKFWRLYSNSTQFPLTGRISLIVPFIPFSVEEQAVIAHKYLLQLVRRVRKPLSLPGQMIGNVILRIPQELAVCRAIIKDCYDCDTGARSIEAAVKVKVEGLLVREYLAVNAAISEGQEPEEYIIKVAQDGRIKVESGTEA
jgi:ATP-dependent Clp protease ATP-binding subunit ClpA